ncbi:ATP-binding protein [Paenibacillus sp. HWE-109]|uniref:HD domain-containing protein n=1 Tax=Paenibacillus sp. HWE-109 TaxID=1306526 RepID=UPI001EDFDAF4|nr:ATP-binding protein [Paenibacillus sp. HWE-109]UKS27372.1 ATP-binding protein [Paenibacillus sp. HWE-109]
MMFATTPKSVIELDLMKRLKSYFDGNASWKETVLSDEEKIKCGYLYTALEKLISISFLPILNRTNSQEMKFFTMHDENHGLKVAHLMWNLIAPSRRQMLTPPEIALMTASAFFHDLGMALSENDRAARLDSNSDLWDRLSPQEQNNMEILRQNIGDINLSETDRRIAQEKLLVAEEALLCLDTRERHGLTERYTELINELQRLHLLNEASLPDIKTSLTFDGVSFLNKLIDICVSHNQPASVLVEHEEHNPGVLRFSEMYPVGCANVDLQLVAAALRLADIMDFDRERTPAVLFHYLLPETLSILESRSVFEWSKHLAISNWEVGDYCTVYRGHCSSHIVHHGIIQFCSDIQSEILFTRQTFESMHRPWPFALPDKVEAKLVENGYSYAPYNFQLDQNRIYQLLMGKGIYSKPIVAIRELIQNAVDACLLQDSYMELHDKYYKRGNAGKIIIRYEEGTKDHPLPRLTVLDKGVGMDKYVLEKWFLNVGSSYYSSNEFNAHRTQLRKHNIDFAPVSEFGIGFLSTFLLSERVEVETAMWDSPRGDHVKRNLQIDGPTRLIRYLETKNEGHGRFKGTRITMVLSKGNQVNENLPPRWDQIKDYLEEVCLQLPYRLEVEYIRSDGRVTNEHIDPISMKVILPYFLEEQSIRINVDDQTSGLKGQIAIFNPRLAEKLQKQILQGKPEILVKNREEEFYHNLGDGQKSIMIRAGFKIGQAIGLPGTLDGPAARAILSLPWESMKTLRYPIPNLSRESVNEDKYFKEQVIRIWLSYIIENSEQFDKNFIKQLIIKDNTTPFSDGFIKSYWLEKYNAFEMYSFSKIILCEEKFATEDMIEKWEQRIGDPLPFKQGLVTDYVCYFIIRLILPHICEVLVGEENTKLLPPAQDWKRILKNNKQFITKPKRWGLFAAFENEINDYFYYKVAFSSSYFNTNYRERLEGFTEEDITELYKMIENIDFAIKYGRKIDLSKFQETLLSRANKLIGDLACGSKKDGKWRIGDLLR